jgi:uncharacterized membrane protein YeaQ/YmgE (transglycosylase-associated protein family)
MLAEYGFLGWILIGAFAGGLAKLVTPGRDPGGCLLTIVLGVVGAVLMGFLGRLVGWYGPGDGAGFIAAFLGAVLLLLLYRALRR